jgi:hypothetical protein
MPEQQALHGPKEDMTNHTRTRTDHVARTAVVKGRSIRLKWGLKVGASGGPRGFPVAPPYHDATSAICIGVNGWLRTITDCWEAHINNTCYRALSGQTGAPTIFVGWGRSAMVSSSSQCSIDGALSSHLADKPTS